MIPIRKTIGAIKRKNFKTNHAFWYCKLLDHEKTIHYGRNHDPSITIDYSNREHAIRWIQEQSTKFPWIYVPEEIDYATRYHHYYPLLIREGKICGYIKVALNKAYVEDYENELSLQYDEAFICDTFILPDLRGQHLGRTLLSATLSQLTNIRFVYCHIPGWNQASRRLYQHLGFQRIGHIRYIRLMRFRFFSHKPEKIKETGRYSVSQSSQS